MTTTDEGQQSAIELRGYRVMRSASVTLHWPFEASDQHKPRAQDDGFRWDNAARLWGRRFSRVENAVRIREEWAATAGVTAGLILHTRVSCLPPPPPWAALERLRRRFSGEWYVQDLAGALGLGALPHDGHGDRVEWRYGAVDLDEDLRERRVDGQPEEVMDLGTYLGASDEVERGMARPPAEADAEEITRWLASAEAVVAELRRRANAIARQRKRLEQRLIAALGTASIADEAVPVIDEQAIEDALAGEEVQP